uniref:Transmembrane protein n=1 Tax=Panagrellus redivivus TaxID=6233 RepID=A0A7E4VHB2_PANRE
MCCVDCNFTCHTGLREPHKAYKRTIVISSVLFTLNLIVAAINLHYSTWVHDRMSAEHVTLRNLLAEVLVYGFGLLVFILQIVTLPQLTDDQDLISSIEKKYGVIPSS